jgi:hypothetical protein
MNASRPKQSLAQDLLDSLLALIQRHFYPYSIQSADGGYNHDESRAFAQDRSRLLSWVILWPARFMTGKGFTVTGDRYKQIFISIILEAVRYGNTSKVTYRPAWLKHVVQTHFRHHWEEYYAEAKSARAQADHALHVLGRLPRVNGGTDAVSEMSAAHALLARKKPAKKSPVKPTINEQLNLV